MLGTTSVAEPNGVLVYNFTVADDHTYFVEGFGSAGGVTGSAGTSAPLDAVWVHNTCAGAGGAPDESPRPNSGPAEAQELEQQGEAAAAGGADAAEAQGVVARNGTKISGFTGHGVDRAIGDTGQRAGTTPQAILDAVKNPQEILSGVDSQGRPFQIFTGQDARVVVNTLTGRVVSVNPLSGAGAH